MSSYSEGQTHQLMEALETSGFTPGDITKLGQHKGLGMLRGWVRGTHEVKPIDHIINLSVPCNLPFNGAERVSPSKSGVAKLERRGDVLYLDGKPINLFLSEKQKNGGSTGGHDLRKELEKRGNNVSAKVLDHLVAHPDLWPEEWKKDAQGSTVYVFFWDDIFRSPANGYLFVRCGYWDGGKVVSLYHWLGGDWSFSYPAASTA